MVENLFFFFLRIGRRPRCTRSSSSAASDVYKGQARYRAIISIIVVLFGIFITTSGLVNIATSIRSLVFNGVAGWLTMALSVVTVIFGIVAITKSSQLTEGIVRFIGVSFIVYAVLGVVSLIQVKHMTDRVKDAVDSVSDIEVDAKEVDDDK